MARLTQLTLHGTPLQLPMKADWLSRIPPEITGHIFCLCRGDLASYDNVDYGPLLVMHVCRLWRRIAIGTPELWTDVALGHLGDNSHWIGSNGAEPFHSK